jgi:predicted metalloprotease with PDZ domain
MSYYLKGEMVTLLLDLLIRSTSHNQRSFDDVMSQMWVNFGREEIGFTEFQLRDVITEVAQVNLTTFFAEYVDGLTELPFNEYLAPFGLELVPIYESPTPYTGMTVVTEHGKAMIKNVVANSPSQLAGIDPGNELLAINNFKITADQLDDRLSNYQTGDTINITCFQGDRLITVPLTLQPPQPTKYQIKFMDVVSREQRENLEKWLVIDS